MENLGKVIANLGVYEDLISVHDDTHISIQVSPLFGIKLHFEKVSQTEMAYYFTVRTSSWAYDGERSDLHDIISLCFAIFLKSTDSIFASLVIISEDHPFCDNEIYCRYIIPDKNGIIDYNYCCPVNLIAYHSNPSEMYFKHISDGFLFSKPLISDSTQVEYRQEVQYQP